MHYQCINSIVFKYVNDQCSNYLNEVFQTAPEKNIRTRGSFQKLKYPFRKTNADQMALSYTSPTKHMEQNPLRHLSEQKSWHVLKNII